MDHLRDLSPADKIALNEDAARRSIALFAIKGYFVLLAANITVPVVLYLLSGPVRAVADFDDIRNLTLGISGALSSIVGVLGFILGYYFKASETTRGKSR